MFGLEYVTSYLLALCVIISIENKFDIVMITEIALTEAISSCHCIQLSL